jgi:drug/metabolite transporter (DMT)-like permease
MRDDTGLPPQLRAMNATEWSLLLLLALLWGGTFFFAKVALAAFPALTLVALRTGIAALALLAFLALRGIALPLSPAAWGRFLVMGLLNNAIPFALINWGQTQIDSGLAAILMGVDNLNPSRLVGRFVPVPA